MKSLHFVVTGRVQGVGYRVWCRRVARSLQIFGWVKNNEDGSVEGLAQGEKLEEFTAELWKGPRFAAVEDVVVAGIDSDEFSDFDITD